MTRYPQKKQNGFTLIETVIVIALSTCMVVILSLLIYTFNNASAYEQAAAKSSGSATALLRDIESLAVPADAVAAAHAFSGHMYMSSSTVLVLEIPSIDATGNVIAATYDYAVFYIVGTNAYRILEANAASARTLGTKLLSTTVSTLTFSYNNADVTQADIITVDVQTQTLVKQNIIQDRRHEAIRLRNK